MLSFIDIYGFLSVVLRGLSMIAQAISFGGAAFCLLAITPRARRRDPTAVTLFGRCARIVFVAACALAGGTLLLVTDTIARTLVAPQQLPVGVITALLGVPTFIALLLGRGGRR